MEDEHPPTSAESSPPRAGVNVLEIVVVLFVILLIAYISISDGIDYVHGFGKACLVVHGGWHFHFQCGSVTPPNQ